MREVLRDARKSAEAHLAFFNRFQPDSLVIFNDIYLEAEAVGMELEFPEDDISRPKGVLLEDKSKLSGLRVPDPKKEGRIPYYFEVCQRIAEQVQEIVPVGPGHCGPWNLAMHLRGVEKLLIDTMQDPEFVHDLMKFTTNVVQVMGDAMIEAGFGPSIAEACASCTLISPQIYRDFIKPYHKELLDYFRAKRAPVPIHVCGFIDPIMEDMISAGFNFISIDAPSSLDRMVELSGGRVIIMGNVQTSLFTLGSHEEMEKAARNCIDTAAADNHFILCSGCEIPRDSTMEVIEYFFQCGHKYGAEYLAGLS
jgi:uroporphyrinogen decarboxylase